MIRRGPVLAVATALAVVAPDALATVGLTVRPVFGEACQPQHQPAELVVTVDNPLAAPWTGTVAVDDATPADNWQRTVRTVPVVVDGRGRVAVRITTPSPVTGNHLEARLVDARGHTVATTPLAATQGAAFTLVDATPGTRLALALRAAADPGLGGLSPDTAGSPGGLNVLAIDVGSPWGGPMGASGDAAVRVPAGLVACAAERSAETGEITLPRTAAGYGNAALVVMDTGTLLNLPTRERTALADYVLGGGTLALVVSSPEDLRSPVAVALAGESVQAGTPTPLPPGAGGWLRPLGGPAMQTLPGTETLGHAVAWHGGRLHHRALPALLPTGAVDLLGATADYGRGQVHLLSWNPTRAPALDDPWSRATVVRLAGLTAARQDGRLFPLVPDTTPVPQAVRTALAQSDRDGRALVRALGGLAGYGVLAGPLSLWLAARRRRSLRGWLALPMWAAGAWGVMANVGGAARESLAHTRAVAMMDVPAGFSRGAVRRYRGVVASRGGPLGGPLGVTRQSPDATLVADPLAARGTAILRTDGQGVALRGVAGVAWTPAVVREDATETLAGWVGVLPLPGGGVRVVNRLHHALTDVVVLTADGETGWGFRRVGAGATADTQESVRLPLAVVTGLVGTHGAMALPAWDSPEANALAAAWGNMPRASAGPGLAAWFGHPDQGVAWSAALAVPAVPGVETRWQQGEEPTVLARVADASTGRGDVASREDFWLRVRGYGGAP